MPGALLSGSDTLSHDPRGLKDITMKTVLRFLTLVLASAALLLSADVTGKWKLSFQTPDGQTRENTLTLKAEGDKLTGSLASQRGETQISDGKVAGDDVSFVVVRNFGGNEVKMNYKGKVSGNEIKFNISAGDQFNFDAVAKRAE